MGQPWSHVDLDDAALVDDVLARQPIVRTAFAERPERRRVPFLDGSGVGLGSVASSLDRIAYNLLFVIKLNNNLLTRDQAIAAAGDLEPHWLDRAVADLVVTGLGTILDTGELTLFDDIAGRIDLPIPSFRDFLPTITSEKLRRAAALAGLDDVGTRKEERAAAVASVITDGEAIARVLERLSLEARQVFALLMQRTFAGFPSHSDIPGAHSAYEILPDELRRLGLMHAYSPIRELADSLLIGADWNYRDVWIWAEMASVFDMRLTADWDPPSLPDVVTLDPDGPDAIVETLHALDEILAAAAATPALGNKSGGRRPPVKYWRSVAKAAGTDAELTVRCGNLAIELGLLVPELGPIAGRGRGATRDCFWVPEPSGPRRTAYNPRSSGGLVWSNGG
ncbi:MAG: hypothetical protein R2710_26335 [Acidimicrobiales bacterium]